MRKKSFITTFLGCNVNAYEVDAVAHQLINNGYVRASDDDENVDVAIINTCSVTATSDQKSRQHIRRLIQKYPHAIVVVMGCFTQMNPSIMKEIPEISILLGTSNRTKILDYIEQFNKTHEPIVAIEPNSREFTYEDFNVTPITSHARAYLKVQDGCDNFCSYCIIPYSRGRSRSRSVGSILREAQDLVRNGYKEIILTGINTGVYGLDIGTNLTSLIKEIIHVCPTLYRLRVSSIELSEVSDELLELMKENKVVARHLHIPLQAGSDEILKKMNRHYDTKTYLNRLNDIRKLMPDIAITSDVIVGFPSETGELFNDSVEFIKKCQFSELHVFPYSPRSGTAAAKYPHQVSKKEKKRRVNILLQVSDDLHAEYKKKFLNKEVEVLIEGYDSKTKTYFGHTSNYLLVDVKSDTDITHKVIKTILKN